MKTDYLVIGNSVAAVNAIEAIREHDTKKSVMVISDEAVDNYSRPLISYYLGGRLGRSHLDFRPPSFHADNKVELVTGVRADKVDSGAKTVTLADGRKISFGKLLICTGGAPFIPKLDGYEPEMGGVFTFTKLEDADRMLTWISRNHIKEAVVMGAGLIGLKAAEGLLERGIKVKMVELGDRILATTLDKDASAILETRLKAGGCEIYKNNSIERIIGEDGRVTRVVLRDREYLSTSLLVLAAGVRPDLSLVSGTGIESARGIIVDDHMRTSARGIWAAGDCAEGKDFLSGEKSVIAIWPVAARQGRVAGLDMAGAESEYPGLFAMNAVQVMDIPAISFGITNPPEGAGYEVLVREDAEAGDYRKIVIRKNRVVGVILLTAIERAGIYGLLIREKVDVSKFKNDLLSDDFGFLALPREFRAHMVTGEGMEV
jgi:NAD(P)H-nitrite reductase large subunit